MMGIALRRAGCIVDETDLGEEGLSLASVSCYDTIFVDDILPDISGFDIIETFRAGGYRGTILFTSTSHDFSARALALGADRIVTIPIDYDAMVDAVRAARAPA